MHFKQNTHRIIISLLITGVVLAILFQFVDINDAKILFQANWLWLGIGLITFAINYSLRTLRFRILLNAANISYKDLYGVTAVYGMLNFLMPSKSGEISYLYLVKRYLNVSLTESTATLITARFFDFASIALFLPVILIVFWEQLPTWALYSATAFCILITVTSLFFLLFLRRPAVTKQELPRHHGTRLRHYWLQLTLALQEIYEKGCYANTLTLTLGIWLTIYVNFYCIANGLGIEVTLFQMIVVSVILVPLTLIPLQGVANLGAHELGWTTALTLFGYDAKTALTIAVGSHVILFIFVMILGGAGFAILGTKPKAQQTDP